MMPTRVSPEEYKRRTAQAVRLLLAPNGYSVDHVARECGLLPEQVGRTKTVLDVLRWELGYAL